MRTALMEALRKTADQIEKGTIRYKWTSTIQCNCGTLLQVITGYDDEALTEPLYSSYDARDYYPIGDVRHSLYHCYSALAEKLGVEITRWELVALEQCNDPEVCRRVRGWRIWRVIQRNKPASVIRYMRTWADMLEREGRDNLMPRTHFMQPVIKCPQPIPQTTR
jgi:hypothetical protein